MRDSRDRAILRVLRGIRNEIQEQGHKIMTAVKTATDKIQASLDQITADVKALDDAIVQFQTNVGTLSPEDQAALDAVVAKSAALAASAGIIPAPPQPLPPPVPVTPPATP